MQTVSTTISTEGYATVKELIDIVNELKLLPLPENTLIMYSIEFTLGNKLSLISCGECRDGKDILLEVHNCPNPYKE